MSNAAGSLYPPPPAYCEAFTSDSKIPDPPPPLEGEFVTFGINGNSVVSIPQLQGVDLVEPEKKGAQRAFLHMQCECRVLELA